MPRKTIEQLEHEAAHKDREIERLSKDNADLQAGMKASDDVTRELERKLKQMGPDNGVDRSEGLIGLAAYVWSLPEGRVSLLAVSVYLRMFAYEYYEQFWRNNIVCGGVALYLFCKWNEEEYRRNGINQLLMKWALFGGGLYLTWLTFCGIVTEPLQAATFVLVIAYLLTISKLTQRMAARVSELFERAMHLPLLAWAKGWLS